MPAEAHARARGVGGNAGESERSRQSQYYNEVHHDDVTTSSRPAPAPSRRRRSGLEVTRVGGVASGNSRTPGTVARRLQHAHSRS